MKHYARNSIIEGVYNHLISGTEETPDEKACKLIRQASDCIDDTIKSSCRNSCKKFKGRCLNFHFSVPSLVKMCEQPVGFYFIKTI